MVDNIGKFHADYDFLNSSITPTQAYFQAYTNRKIENSSDMLRISVKEIKNYCHSLGMNFSDYAHLPQIKNEEDLVEWVGFGKNLTNKLSSGKMDVIPSSIELMQSYYEIGILTNYEPLANVAKNILKIAIEKHKLSKDKK